MEEPGWSQLCSAQLVGWFEGSFSAGFPSIGWRLRSDHRDSHWMKTLIRSPVTAWRKELSNGPEIDGEPGWSQLCSAPLVGWFEGLLSASCLSLPASATSWMLPFSASANFSKHLHNPQSMNFETGNTKPAKQTRQMVIRYWEHQVSGFHLISTLELFILYPLCCSFDKSKLAPFILSSWIHLVSARFTLLSLCNWFHTFQYLQRFTCTKNTNTKEVESDKTLGIHHFLQTWWSSDL